MFEPFLLVGGLFFWIFASIFGVILLACVEQEKGSAATITATIAVILFLIWGDFNLFGWVVSNTLSFLMYLVGYFVIGTVWTVVKWYFYLLARKSEAIEFKGQYCQSNGITGDMTEDQRKKFIESLVGYSSTYRDDTFPPNATNHKSDIVRWAAYWPFSAFWTLLGDGIRRLWDFIYVQIGGMLQKMSSKVMGDI